MLVSPFLIRRLTRVIAVLFDPYDEAAMAGAMKRLLAEAARQTLAVLERAAGEGRP